MSSVAYGFARDHGLCVDAQAGLCLFTTDTPGAALVEVQRCVAAPLAFTPASKAEVRARLEQTYGDSARQAAEEVAEDDTDLAALANAAEVDDLLDQREDAPTVRLINALLLQAVKSGTSDIHIELEEKRLVVRFRTDGVLTQVLEPKRAIAPTLVSRIKVMGKLDIAEKRVDQDGRVSLRVGSHELDVRISTLPTQFGERVVLRLLDRSATSSGIAHLGMAPEPLARMQGMLGHANGLVLVTGPTGAGKTTTLYAALDKLNDGSRNIMTVENPIEYALPGIGQTQVNQQTDMTFARALRAILRQDPDVIMVGEIRDQETAQISVESAMTGHLVLSTVHTNTAVGAITRMRNLGVEPFLLAPMVRGLIAQRLVRRLCAACKEPVPTTEVEARYTGGALPPGSRHYRAQGCAACSGQGHTGRVAIYEVVAAGPGLENLIQSEASEAEITAHVRTQSKGLFEDGLSKVQSGEVALSELMRVLGDAKARSAI